MSGSGPAARQRVTAVVAVLLTFACASAALGARGGPDALGYLWFDQDDGCSLEAPVFTAAAQSFPDPLAAVGPFSLGFAMPFAGGVVTDVWVSPTGFVAFSDQGAEGASTATQLLPDARPPSHLVASLWRPALALSVVLEASPGRFDVQWTHDGRFGPEPTWLTLWSDGTLQSVWGTSFNPAADSTVGYEDAAGVGGTTGWRDGAAIEPSFPPPGAGRSGCFQPPPLLDCTDPEIVACGDSVVTDLPAAAARQAEVYSCAGSLYRGNERVVRVDVAEPARLLVGHDSADVDLFRVAAPPECTESACLDFADSLLDLPLVFVGSEWIVLDRPLPGGESLRVDTTCLPLPTLACGETRAGTTVLAPAVESSCADVTLDGSETHYLVTTPATGHVSASLRSAVPELWVVIRSETGVCLAAGRGGATAFDVAAGRLVITVDGEAGVASDFSITLECGTRLGCGSATAAACDSAVSGDTAATGVSRVDRYACDGLPTDGAEQVFLLTNPREQVVTARFLTSQPGQQLFLLDGCDEGRCVLGGTEGDCSLLPAGDYLLVVDGPAGGEGPFEVELACRRITSAGVDVRVVSVDGSTLVTDCRSLDVDGVVALVLANDGAVDALAPFDVVAFLDDGTGSFEGLPGDVELGRLTVVAGLPAGAEIALDVGVAGTLPFRSAALAIHVDPTGVLPDVDRGNDRASTAWSCLGVPPPSSIDLAIEWEWTGGGLAPLYTEVETVPIVADLDGDARPEVIFTAEDFDRMTNTGSVIRAVRGTDGSDLWAAEDPALRTTPGSMLAVGDLDGDGSPEIVGQSHEDPTRLVCLDATGALRWLSDPLPALDPFDTWAGGPAIADFDGDGRAEVVWGPNAVDADGALFWTPEAGGTFGGADGGPESVIADLDGDGVPEVIAGPTAYRWDPPSGTAVILWRAPDVEDGYAAVADLDDDPRPEVVVAAHYKAWLLEGESGIVKWEVELPAGGGAPCGGFSGLVGGPPTVGDVDDDGEPEILVMGADWLFAFEADGSVLWQAPVWECSSGTTSATIFDLDGDGWSEVILIDQVALRVLRGTDGVELASAPHDSGTAREIAVVADVDADGHAEIVVPDNRLLGGGVPGGLFGVRVYGSASSPWQGARAVWNQHAYHVTNVEESLAVPAPSSVACLPPSPLAEGTFRVQRASRRPGPLAPNLTLTLLSAAQLGQADCLRELEVVVRVGNAGAVGTGRDVSVAFFDGDPRAGGGALSISLAPPLPPGGWLDVRTTFWWPVTVPVDVWAWADSDASGVGVIAECREDDNHCVVSEADLGGTPLVRPASIGPALRATDHGDPFAADITATFEWSGDEGAPRVLGTAPGEEHYHVLRGELGNGPPLLAIVSGIEPWLAVTYDDSTPATPRPDRPHAYGYRILAASDCELTSAD